VKLLKTDNFVLVITMGNPNKEMFADDARGLFIVEVRFPML